MSYQSCDRWCEQCGRGYERQDKRCPDCGYENGDGLGVVRLGCGIILAIFVLGMGLIALLALFQAGAGRQP
jgi:hypothetical protein